MPWVWAADRSEWENGDEHYLTREYGISSRGLRTAATILYVVWDPDYVDYEHQSHAWMNESIFPDGQRGMVTVAATTVGEGSDGSTRYMDYAASAVSGARTATLRDGSWLARDDEAATLQTFTAMPAELRGRNPWWGGGS